MRDNKLVLNFLVYADRVANGALQSDLLQEISDLGFTQVEIRREYFKDIKKEISVIQSEAERLDLKLFYSVPDEVYVNGELNPKLQQYLNELKALVDSGVAISIENDQTQTSGTISAINTFMNAIKKTDLSIGYVYDLGNWRFVGEDEIKAAESLKDYVRYIHVKDVEVEKGQPQAIGLDHGDIDWRKVLQILPQDVPVAIEYPTTANDEILEAKELLESEF